MQMAEFLKSVDIWFLVLAIIFLGGWFVWSVKKIFGDFTAAVADLRLLIRELFEKHNDHEGRLSRLEGEHNARINGPGYGRRLTDGMEPSPRFE
jgi:hypothetical protein